jgi:hypothetical protein
MSQPAAECSPRPRSGHGRYELLPRPIKVIYLLAPVAAPVLFVLHWFSVPLFGHVLAGTAYYYLLYGRWAFNIFMGQGATAPVPPPPPWYDYALGLRYWA